MTKLGDAVIIGLSRHARADGEVVAAESAAQVPFRIERMFILTAPIGSKRGHHAHRLCCQFMICVSGAVSVSCEDGDKQQTFILNRRDRALLVPPGLWNTVEFLERNSALVVLCDRVYEADDYIRDYDEFLSFRESVRV